MNVVCLSESNEGRALCSTLGLNICISKRFGEASLSVKGKPYGCLNPIDGLILVSLEKVAPPVEFSC